MVAVRLAGSERISWIAMSLFCRHNRFVADCPICSKGTVLDPARSTTRRSSRSGVGTKRSAARAEKPAFSGPNVTSPAYEDAEGGRYVVGLERVPGGVRLAEWSLPAGQAGSQPRRRAPALPPADLVELVKGGEEVLNAVDAEVLAAALQADPPGPTEGRDPASAGPAVSRGRSGDFKEELRVEPLEDGNVRVGRWVLRPAQGWQLQEAPPMLPAKRYAEALGAAMKAGFLPAPS